MVSTLRRIKISHKRISKNKSSYFTSAKTRKRIYATTLATLAVKDYIEDLGLKVDEGEGYCENFYLLETFDIADLKVNNARIDVRCNITRPYTEVWIPKDSYKFGYQFDFYVAVNLAITKDRAEILGFLTREDIEQAIKEESKEKNYYVIPAKRLRSPQSLFDAVMPVANIVKEEDPIKPAEHEIIQELFVSFLDNTLSPQELKFFQTHLKNCEICREMLSNLYLFERTVKSYTDIRAFLDENITTELIKPETGIDYIESIINGDNISAASTIEPITITPEFKPDVIAEEAFTLTDYSATSLDEIFAPPKPEEPAEIVEQVEIEQPVQEIEIPPETRYEEIPPIQESPELEEIVTPLALEEPIPTIEPAPEPVEEIQQFEIEEIKEPVAEFAPSGMVDELIESIIEAPPDIISEEEIVETIEIPEISTDAEISPVTETIEAAVPVEVESIEEIITSEVTPPQLTEPPEPAAEEAQVEEMSEEDRLFEELVARGMELEAEMFPETAIPATEIQHVSEPPKEELPIVEVSTEPEDPSLYEWQSSYEVPEAPEPPIAETPPITVSDQITLPDVVIKEISAPPESVMEITAPAEAIIEQQEESQIQQPEPTAIEAKIQEIKDKLKPSQPSAPAGETPLFEEDDIPPEILAELQLHELKDIGYEIPLDSLTPPEPIEQTEIEPVLEEVPQAIEAITEPSMEELEKEFGSMASLELKDIISSSAEEITTKPEISIPQEPVSEPEEVLQETTPPIDVAPLVTPELPAAAEEQPKFHEGEPTFYEEEVHIISDQLLMPEAQSLQKPEDSITSTVKEPDLSKTSLEEWPIEIPKVKEKDDTTEVKTAEIKDSTTTKDPYQSKLLQTIKKELLKQKPEEEKAQKESPSTPADPARPAVPTTPVIPAADDFTGFAESQLTISEQYQLDELTLADVQEHKEPVKPEIEKLFEPEPIMESIPQEELTPLEPRTPPPLLEPPQQITPNDSLPDIPNVQRLSRQDEIASPAFQQTDKPKRTKSKDQPSIEERQSYIHEFNPFEKMREAQKPKFEETKEPEPTPIIQPDPIVKPEYAQQEEISESVTIIPDYQEEDIQQQEEFTGPEEVQLSSDIIKQLVHQQAPEEPPFIPLQRSKAADLIQQIEASGEYDDEEDYIPTDSQVIELKDFVDTKKEEIKKEKAEARRPKMSFKLVAALAALAGALFFGTIGTVFIAPKISAMFDASKYVVQKPERLEIKPEVEVINTPSTVQQQSPANQIADNMESTIQESKKEADKLAAAEKVKLPAGSEDNLTPLEAGKPVKEIDKKQITNPSAAIAPKPAPSKVSTDPKFIAAVPKDLQKKVNIPAPKGSSSTTATVGKKATPAVAIKTTEQKKATTAPKPAAQPKKQPEADKKTMAKALIKPEKPKITPAKKEKLAPKPAPKTDSKKIDKSTAPKKQKQQTIPKPRQERLFAAANAPEPVLQRSTILNKKSGPPLPPMAATPGYDENRLSDKSVRAKDISMPEEHGVVGKGLGRTYSSGERQVEGRVSVSENEKNRDQESLIASLSEKKEELKLRPNPAKVTTETVTTTANVSWRPTGSGAIEHNLKSYISSATQKARNQINSELRANKITGHLPTTVISVKINNSTNSAYPMINTSSGSSRVDNIILNAVRNGFSGKMPTPADPAKGAVEIRLNIAL